jgi:phage protein D
MWPRMVQTDETDWQFIVALAQRIGYVVSSSGVTVFFQDPLKLVRNTGVSVPLSSLDANSSNPANLKSNMRVGARGNITQFTQLTVNGLDSAGNVITGSTAYDLRASYFGRTTIEPTTARTSTSCSPQDAGHAQVIAQATNNPDQWPLQNTVIAKGDGRLRAGGIASLGLGNTSEMGGLWFTRSVSHSLGRASYLMTTELARDAVSKSPDTTPVIVSSDRSGPLAQPAQPVLLNNRWTSPWSPS